MAGYSKLTLNLRWLALCDLDFSCIASVGCGCFVTSLTIYGNLALLSSRVCKAIGHSPDYTTCSSKYTVYSLHDNNKPYIYLDLLDIRAVSGDIWRACPYLHIFSRETLLLLNVVLYPVVPSKIVWPFSRRRKGIKHNMTYAYSQTAAGALAL